MTPPSEEYKKFCDEHQKKLRELWEKRGLKFGDWVIDLYGELGIINCWDDVKPAIYINYPGGAPGSTGGKLWVRRFYSPAACTWLPTLRQLIDMLEERGWFPEILPKLRVDGSKFYRIEARKRLGDSVLSWLQIKITVGPDPEIAVGRALMEAIEKEE